MIYAEKALRAIGNPIFLSGDFRTARILLKSLNERTRFDDGDQGGPEHPAEVVAGGLRLVGGRFRRSPAGARRPQQPTVDAEASAAPRRFRMGIPPAIRPLPVPDACADPSHIAVQMSFLFDTLAWPVVFPQLSTLE